MPFRDFRYHPDTKANLKVLLRQGSETFDALKGEIEKVKREWDPPAVAEPQKIVPFAGFLLGFTPLESDESVLLLATVDPQP